MPKKLRATLWVIAGTLLALVILGVALTLKPSPSLRGSRRIGELPPADVISSTGDRSPLREYVWLDGSRVLVHHYTGVDLIDFATWRKRELPMSTPFLYLGKSASPDGNWVACQIGAQLQNGAVSSDLKSIATAGRNKSGGLGCVFLPDSTGFVTYINGSLYQYKFAEGKAKPIGPMPRGSMLGFDPSDHILIYQWSNPGTTTRPNPGQQITIKALDPLSLSVISSYTVSVPYVPSEISYPGLTLSPTGDRIRWDFLCAETRPV